MGTYDEILGTGNNPPKGSQEWHEQQQNGSSASSSAKDTGQETVTAPAPAATGSKPDTVETPPAQQDASSGSLSYAELFKQLNPYKPPTEEELAKERKKQKREQIFAAIGDGISALSNLFFTTQYAPNMYTGKDTASGKVKVKYDRLMKERNANARAYASGLIGAMQADDAKADGERKWLRQLGIDDYNRKRNDAKDERDRQMFELNLQLQNHKISAAEADAKRKGIEAKYAEELEKAKVETEKARGAAQRAGASASNARAGYYNRGGSGGKEMTLTIDGKTHTYKTKEDYERAVMRYAKEYGIDTFEDVVVTTEDDMNGKNTKTSKRGRDVSKIAGDVEETSNKKKKTGLGLGNGESKSNSKKTGLGL